MSMFSVETQGLAETNRALDGVRADLAKREAGELRAAGEDSSRDLSVLLVAGAGSSGVPVAPLVARSVRPVSAGKPAVSIGGGLPVGRYGAPAARLLWGSEHGPAGEPNHFAVAANAGGYWIKPTLERFKRAGAVKRYQTAVDRIIAKHGLR
jgi:hypothetical protein